MGLGSFLVEAAEAYAAQKSCKFMQLEVLSPVSYKHPAKAWLDVWYQRIGYVKDPVDHFNTFFRDKFPQAVPMLVCECKLHFYRKKLRVHTSCNRIDDQKYRSTQPHSKDGTHLQPHLMSEIKGEIFAAAEVSGMILHRPSVNICLQILCHSKTLS